MVAGLRTHAKAGADAASKSNAAPRKKRNCLVEAKVESSLFFRSAETALLVANVGFLSQGGGMARGIYS
jgi:hypothetical protein